MQVECVYENVWYSRMSIKAYLLGLRVKLLSYIGDLMSKFLVYLGYAAMAG